jgi:hypothetical protein
MSDDALQAWLQQRGLRIEQVRSMHATCATKVLPRCAAAAADAPLPRARLLRSATAADAAL